MSAKQAVLGLLMERPSYQYLLTDRMEERMGPGWTGLSGQVSQVIRTLQKEGLIRPVEHGEDAPGSDRPRHYEITDDGISEFESFLDKDAPVKLPRRSIQVQLAFAGKARLERVLERLDAYERECTRRLEELMGRYQAGGFDRPLRADRLLLRLSLSADLGHLEAELNWARQARETVSWLMTREAVWPSSREAARTAAQQARHDLFARLADAERSEVLPTEGEDCEGEVPR